MLLDSAQRVVLFFFTGAIMLPLQESYPLRASPANARSWHLSPFLSTSIAPNFAGWMNPWSKKAGSGARGTRAGCNDLIHCRLRGGRAVYNESWEQSYREGCPSIWAAARVGDRNNLRNALETQHPDATDEDGRTALHWATVAGRDSLVEELLQRGASALKVDLHGWTPLHCAASCGKANILALVLPAALEEHPRAADVQTADERRATPLLLACGKNESAAVQLLLSVSKSAICMRDADGFTPLLRAGMQGNMGIVDLLLAEGADINEQDYLGNSSLHYMCNGLSKKQIPRALQLLERGADPLLENKAGDTPVDALDMDVARALARENLAMKRRKGAAARGEDEQRLLEQSIVRESLEKYADVREGPEHVSAPSNAHTSQTCSRTRAITQADSRGKTYKDSY